MHKFFAVLFLTFVFAAVLFAQNDTGKFRFKPKKVSVGAVYHYLKTNIDGTNPEHISQFIHATDKLEAFKFHPQATRAGLVIATMDWRNFSARRLESWQVFKDEKRKLFATLNYNDAEKSVEVAFPGMNKASERTAIKYLPFHVYNFDFGSLNFAFPHLVNPEKSFTIGIADPTFKDPGVAFAYRGEATITYVGNERRNNIVCRKYSVGGNGLENRGGFIWVNKKGGYIEDMEIALPDNPDWTSFKLRLTKVEKMTPQEWEAFIKKQF